MSTNHDSFLFPPQASTFAKDVDSVYYFIHYLSIFFWVLIVGAIVFFVWRYKRGHKEGVGPSHSLPLELTWSIIPLVLVIAMFLWGFKTFMYVSRAPGDATDIHVTGAKWSWTFEYPNGLKEMNELHAVIDKPVRLVMTSTDVIHSFYVPTFRNKMDVVPGRYSTFWFQPTVLGPQQVFCAEYCGDGHSEMLAKIIVQTQEEYDAWMKETAKEDTTTPLPELGAKLFQSKACFTCHNTDTSAKVGPGFQGIFGHEVELDNGTKAMVDENYIRTKLLTPRATTVRGFPPVMPSFQGQLTDREIDGLIEYIKSLK
ncbi:cytochrome c oxidase subunit II [Vulgatibacter incomptus]|uniref:Cytochrome c oxidase subunit 2 n=1 Tax=Vulgatibacter incomptus TaxID=1391653 RepID=A0A0K1PH24_9BACT|nr:cytochrome c oxidase subunit II [Vulgatibacter incomptus]AKU92807.1 Cytochrome c oxidase polypeptide II [Vulgatibacter incomptus]